MLRFLATLSPGALVILAGLAGALPSLGVGYLAGKAIGHHVGYREGTAAMAAEVERRNAAAAETARRAKLNVDACYDAGGTWDQSTGRCDR